MVRRVSRGEKTKLKSETVWEKLFITYMIEKILRSIKQEKQQNKTNHILETWAEIIDMQITEE